MSNFSIKVPQAALDSLQNQREEIVNLQTMQKLPYYNQFVKNLMKGMNTPAEELHHAATGIAGEAGEILDISKKVWVYNKELDLNHVFEELGDLRFYYQAMLNLFGLSDEDIVGHNMTKLRKRYASGAYSDAQANARADKNPALAENRRFMGRSVDENGIPIDIPTLGQGPLLPRENE